jgi:predicted CoA-binding protein
MDIETILRTYRQIAIVGISDKPDRPSNSVARYMIHAGYKVYAVNPILTTVLGLPCYPSLTSMPEEIRKNVEIVNIFRKPADVCHVVDEAAAIGAKVVWMQLGITNEAAAEKARNAGIDTVVQNRCIAVEHQHLQLRCHTC